MDLTEVLNEMMPKAIQMPVLGPVMGRAEKELLCFEPKLIKNPRKSASTKKKGFNPPIETGTGLGTPCARGRESTVQLPYRNVVRNGLP